MAINQWHTITLAGVVSTQPTKVIINGTTVSSAIKNLSYTHLRNISIQSVLPATQDELDNAGIDYQLDAVKTKPSLSVVPS